MEHQEQAKLENQVKALQARLEAAEKGATSGAVETSAEPSAEILDALQMLAAENAKLRVDLDKYKHENAILRHENQELRRINPHATISSRCSGWELVGAKPSTVGTFRKSAHG